MAVFNENVHIGVSRSLVVGVSGTPAPRARVDIVGATGGDHLRVSDNVNATLIVSTPAPNEVRLRTNSERQYLTFYSGSAGGIERLRISGNGDVHVAPSAKFVVGRDPQGVTNHNDPNTHYARSVASHDVHLDDQRAVTETESVYVKQAVVRGDVKPGATSANVNGEWSEFELAEGGDHLGVFWGGALVTNVRSASFGIAHEGEAPMLLGMEFDTNADPNDAGRGARFGMIRGVSSYSGVNSGACSVTGSCTAFNGVATNNGTSHAGELASYYARTQLSRGATATTVINYFAGDITPGPGAAAAGQVTGSVYKFYAQRGSFRGVAPNGRNAMYAFYAEDGAGGVDGPRDFNSRFGGGGFDNGHVQLGDYHLWVDATGNLRIKNGAPTRPDDGAIVGATR